METEKPLTFVDVFAGAGGLSLGLLEAGLVGLFGVEKDPNAFETLKANLVDRQDGPRYKWPDWLPKEPIEMGTLMRDHRERLIALQGSVDVLAGGPPCQGFSAAGRRKRSDPRNKLWQLYVEMAELLKPPMLVFENVPGIAIEFDKGNRRRRNPRGLGRPARPFSYTIARELDELGYWVHVLRERAADFGVPQLRPRYLILAISRDRCGALADGRLTDMLGEERKGLLAALSLPLSRPLTVKQAISDLLTQDRELVASDDSPRFKQVSYSGPITTYQRLMHRGLDTTKAPNSMRLANHREETVKRSKLILADCRKGVVLSRAEREKFDMRKTSLTPLDPNKPSHTLTSLPDDFLHYSEPRILTVREYARLQSFPDWFEFRGKYTTGGERRRNEVPRYTQVANAVPPLLARAVGQLLVRLGAEVLEEQQQPLVAVAV